MEQRRKGHQGDDGDFLTGAEVLENFIAEYTNQIVDRASLLSQARDPRRHEHPAKADIATFLAQVASTLRRDGAAADHTLHAAAGRQGASMLRGGHPIVDVVQSYGDICQAVTSVAAEVRSPISAEDFCVFNRCLDDAIGHAVGEYNRIADERRTTQEIQHLGIAAHELRDQLQTARLSLRALQSSRSPIDGTSGQLLERALNNLSTLVERMLSEVRLGADVAHRQSIELAPFLEEVAMTAALIAESRGITFTLDSETSGTLDGDRHQLMSAVMNLVQNALKFTEAGGDVRVTVRMTSTRLFVAVQDQCGGLLDPSPQITKAFTDRRGTDRTGLGLGLSIAKKIIRAHAGDITVRNVPGCGCVFTIELPVVAPNMTGARSH
jgi:signal transduction histidine kinase